MPEKNAMVVDHLTKKFKDQIAVNNVSFSVKQGEVFGLLGPNGAGKTTILRIITTLLEPTSGNVLIFGHDIKKEGELGRSTFGVTGQYASLDEDLSAKENLMVFARLNGLTRKEALHRTQELLAEFYLEKSANKPLKEFSGGMRRRLDLAISLITRPAIIFLDEPTTGLDPRTRKQMWTTIREMVKQGATVFLTTQYLEEADQLADRVAVIDHGKLIKIGTPAELKRENGKSTVTVKIADKVNIDKTAQILKTELHSIPQTLDDTIIVKSQNTEQIIAGLAKLNENHITISDLTIQEPSLDDVFMDLTVGKN